MTDTIVDHRVAFSISQWPGCEGAQYQALQTADRPMCAFVTAYAAWMNDKTSLRGTLSSEPPDEIVRWIRDRYTHYQIPLGRLGMWGRAINGAILDFTDSEIEPVDGLFPDGYQIMAMRASTVAGFCFGLDVGLGKSITAAALASLVVRKKLVSRSRCWIFCPLNVDAWTRFIPDLKLLFDDVRVLSNDSAHKYVGAENTGGVLICDECFPYNTKVETENGPVDIGDIVTHELTHRVRTVENGVLCWKRVVGYTKKFVSEPLVRIRHDTGTLTCTANHPVWCVSRKNWVRADGLVANDTVQILQGAVENSLRHGSEVLQQQLLRSGSLENPLTENDTKQSVAASGGESAFESRSTRQTVPGEAWWQRSDISDREIVQSTVPENEMELSGSTRREIAGVSDVVQSRFRDAPKEDRYRTRRQQPQPPASSDSRQQEDTEIGISRVESVEILEHRCPDGYGGGRETTQDVYCLEVEDTHTFFAEGVLVHNCHEHSHSTARRTKSLHAIRRNFDFCIGLTGTLIHAGIESTLSIADLIVPGMSLFANRWKAGEHFNCLVKKSLSASHTVTSLEKPSGENRTRFHEWLSRFTIKLSKHSPEVKASVQIPEQKLHDVIVDEPWPDLIEEVVRIAEEIFKAEGELPHMQRVVHHLCRAGKESKVDWLLSQITDDTPIVVFAHYRETLDYLCGQLNDAGITFFRIDGDTDKLDRPPLIEAFQRGERQIFVLQTKAGGVGVNLFNSHVSVALDHSWKAIDYAQALGRTCRRGQENFCHHFDLYANDLQRRIVQRVREAQNFDASCTTWQELRRALTSVSVPGELTDE